MKSIRIGVIGGGPAGLFVARLIKLGIPSAEVVVFEEKPPHLTFGYGITFSSTTQRTLGAVDPQLWNEVMANAYRGHGLRIYSDSSSVSLESRDQIAIGRSKLLEILIRYSSDVGVRVNIGPRCDATDMNYDIVIAADGANSATRLQYSDRLGVEISDGRQLFLWCGTDFALEDHTFASVETPFGTFTTHGYPYAPHRSTFLVETAETTWQSSGLARKSSAESATFLAKIFSEHLNGHRLMVSAARWSRFRTVRCQQWYTKNIVLLGDAAHTAHYSIGSGTKLAMESAIALAHALQQHPADVAGAFSAYHAGRAQAVERAQELAERSYHWWEGFGRRVNLSPERLLVSFLSRTGVPLKNFIAKEPSLYRAAIAQSTRLPHSELPPDISSAWIVGETAINSRSREPGDIGAPSEVHTLRTTVKDPWGLEADKVVALCRRLSEGTRTRFELTGPNDRVSVLDRFDLAERLRMELNASVSVEGPRALMDDLAVAFVSGRIDEAIAV